MTPISFTKMHGAGNDFIIVDSRRRILAEDNAVRFAQRQCSRRTGVGADGLILLDDDTSADFRMRHYNPDGSRAPFCGNGARCLARFAYRHGIAEREMQFEADDGRHHAVIDGQNVRLHMRAPDQITLHRSISDYPRTGTLHTIDTGTKHAVIRSEDVKKELVEEDGRTLRYHSMFQPDGTNVNFVQKTGLSQLAIRTYERGVETETLACGTGTVAAAVVFALTDGVSSPVSVHTHGGETLTVDFRQNGTKITDVILTGSAHMVFEGTLGGEL